MERSSGHRSEGGVETANGAARVARQVAFKLVEETGVGVVTSRA